MPKDSNNTKKNDPRYIEWGRKGGQRTSEQYGREYFKYIAKKGGDTTYERYGKEHMGSIARKDSQNTAEGTPDA